ncbi:MAG: hypothetical protein IPJ90_21025 [Anaerolineaceae bacterium]|nr:hypothetical protein [Anaerolineaceae bacterium]
MTEMFAVLGGIASIVAILSFFGISDVKALKKLLKKWIRKLKNVKESFKSRR